MKKLRQRATLDEVKIAITSLNKQGIKPTADNIITEIVRSSNGTVGIAKGTVLKFRRVLESLDNSLLYSSVKSTKTVQFKTTKNTHSKPYGLDESLLSTIESKLKVQLETYLDEKLREQFAVYQVNKLPHDQANEYSPEEALQEMHELWLDSVTRYTEVQAQLENLEREVQRLSEFETQTSESQTSITCLQSINEQLALENQELKAKLEAVNEEIEELSLENSELRLRLSQNNEVQPTNQPEAQQSQFNPLSQDLHELRELWLEAVLQITTPSISVNTTIGTDPLKSYFQILEQLHNLNSAQKYDCAMKLFEQGIGTSEASRILKVNKGSLQHYKDGKRKRPNSD